MHLVIRFFTEVLKSILTAFFIGVFLYIVTVSVILKRFPPTMSDLELVGKKVEIVTGFVLQQLNTTKMNASEASQILSALSDKETIVKEFKNFEEKEKLKSLNGNKNEGEFTFASTPPPSTTTAHGVDLAQIELIKENTLLKEKVKLLEMELNQLRTQKR